MKCKYCVQSFSLEIGCEGGILFGPKYRQSFICGLYSYGSAAVQMQQRHHCSVETRLQELVGLWPAVGGTTATARGCHSALQPVVPGGFWQRQQTVSGQGCDQQGKRHLARTQRGVWAGTGTHTGGKGRLAMIPAKGCDWCGLWAFTRITSVAILLYWLLLQGNEPLFWAAGLRRP